MAEPPDMPEMSPDEISTEAIDVLLLVHVPPTETLEKVVVAPAQIVAIPVMSAGEPFTVMTAVDRQPVGET